MDARPETALIPPALAERGYRFAYSFRVRYRDVDRLGIVFNGNYMSYIDYGITEYMRMLGFPWREMGRYGFDMAVVRSLQEFKAPAFLDDMLHIGVRFIRLGNSSFTVQYTIWGEDAVTGEGKVVLEAEQVYVNYDMATRKSRPIPDVIRKAIMEFEGLTE
jgi:acyl-CoA thioester hydrolase